MNRTLVAALTAGALLSFAASAQASAPVPNPHDLDGQGVGPLILAAEGGQHGHGSMSADSYQVGDLVVEAPWSRASPGGAGGAFMVIHNAGRQSDRLISAASDMAARVEVHLTVMQDGVMRMRHAEDGVEVPAGGMAELKPGGFHVMLMGLTHPLEEGSSFPVTLVFEKAGEVTVDVQVRAAGAMQHSH